jgi:serine/threonine-protein kinase
MWNVRIARRKVRMYEKCRHPAVVPFVDVGTSGGMHYLAWPLVEGETLDKIVAREGKLSPALAALYALQTAQGMAVCHAQGLFHGLLKPSNLMISPEGQVRILDLGIGGLLAETEGESLVDTMSSANSLASGLDCGSPESLMDPNNLSPIGDQYSLGCVLYYCLTGRYPFPDGSAVDKMMAHQMREPEAVNDLNPEVPEALAEVVDRLMQKAPEARYPNTQEIIDALQPLAGPAAQRVPRSGMVRDARLPRRPALASLGDSTPLELRMKSAPGLNEPVRNLSSMALPRTRAPAAASATPNDVPVQPARTPPFPMPQASNPFAVLPQPTLEERLGPVGIAICAIIACAMAWLVTWKLF